MKTKLKYFNTAPYYLANPSAVHGRARKDMAVLHETISPDEIGLADIKSVEQYLANKNYGIHGMTDKEGNIAWARGYGNAIFYQAGGVNARSIGIEQVSLLSIDTPVNYTYWKNRQIELRATAKLLAAIHNTWNIPLRFSDGDSAGITSHWNISQIHPESEGHWDCHPKHQGGYYPILYVISLARIYSIVPGYTL